jgi:tight adherence protein B
MTVSWRPERLSSAPVRMLGVVLAALVLAAGLPALGALDPLPAIAGALLAGGLTARTLRERSRAAADRLADAVAEAIGLLAADVSVGRGLGDALQSLSDDLTQQVEEDPSRRQLGLLLAPVSDGARLGGHVPAALRELAGVPGCEAFGRVAAAWELAETAGTPAAAVLGRVSLAVRAHAEHVRAVRAELAGARASARLLATLPVVGLLMGVGLGAHPMHVLLETSYGQLALCAGVMLELVGLAWTDRIAHRAEAA